jgi:hypothetical protein
MKTLSVGALVALAATIAIMLPAAAAPHRRTTHVAAATEALGSAGAWTAYVAHDQTGRVCYLAGRPVRSDSAGVSRQPPMAMVTHRPAEHVADVVSFVEGYTLKRDSTVSLAIGDRKFDLFTDGDSAWDATSELDRTVAVALAHGTTAVAKGETEHGRHTTDVYSLAGFSKALDMIDKACGVSPAGNVLPPEHAVSRRTAHRPTRNIHRKVLPPRHRRLTHPTHKATEAPPQSPSH